MRSFSRCEWTYAPLELQFHHWKIAWILQISVRPIKNDIGRRGVLVGVFQLITFSIGHLHDRKWVTSANEDRKSDVIVFSIGDMALEFITSLSHGSSE